MKNPDFGKICTNIFVQNCTNTILVFVQFCTNIKKTKNEKKSMLSMFDGGRMLFCVSWHGAEVFTMFGGAR